MADLAVRPLGAAGGLTASCQGLGCMGLSWAYASALAGTPAEKEALLNAALDRGVTLFNSANIYVGEQGSNEELLGRAFAKRERSSFVIATKFGVALPAFVPDLAAASIRGHCEAALQRLDMTYIDLFIVCRQDANVPIEETMGALKELVAEGKVRAVGLSEASAAQIRRAHAVLPLAAVEMEWSLFSRDIEAEIVPTCRALGIAILAYSPLGRGFLSGALSAEEVAAPGPFMGKDFRAVSPRFAPEAWAANKALVDKVAVLAAAKGCTTAQLALAWVHAQGPDVFPIPGTSKLARLEENIAAAKITLTAAELEALATAVPAAAVQGERYNEHAMRMCHSSQPKE